MKKFKIFLFSLLVTKQQRQIIFDSLWFSRYTYIRRGNHIKAGEVLTVFKAVEPLLGDVKKDAIGFANEESRAYSDGVSHDTVG